MSLTLIITAFSVIACALVTGVFLTFSDFVMRSLNRSAARGGIEAMQVINREVFRTLFMVLLIGMTMISVVLIWLSIATREELVSQYILAGGSIYLVFVFAVTLFGNVPMNVQLDRLSPTDQETVSYWSTKFYPRWTAWNHVRTFGSGVASVCFLLALLTP